MPNQNELSNKKALVTGAGKGIGRGIALTLAKAGADIAIHYRSTPQEAESLVEEIQQVGRTAWSIAADLADSKQLEAMFEEISKRWGGLDIAVNNAGWDPGFIDYESIDEDLYCKLTDVNIKGTLFCCLKEIELMKRCSAGGSIINIGSVQQDTTVPGRTLYAMSKGAIHSMTGQLALEAGPHGIRLNNVAPGYIEVARMAENPEYNRDEVAAGIPVQRVGTVDDVGAFTVYLASEESSFLTGQTLTIDGGVSRKLAR